MWITDCGDAANISKQELMMMINIMNSTEFHDVVFSCSPPCFSGGELAFDSKFKLEIFGALVIQLP